MNRNKRNRTNKWRPLFAAAKTVLDMAQMMFDDDDAELFALIQDAGISELSSPNIRYEFEDIVNVFERRHGFKAEPRGKRRKFDHKRAYECIVHDYLGPNATFVDASFKMMFRISRSRFERMLQDVGALEDEFFSWRTEHRGKPVASMEAKLMLPLKTLAYGVPSHAFGDYFQMSNEFARTACKEFDRVMHYIYEDEYLRAPDSTDLQRINSLHREVHGVKGMFGNIDCCHTLWKNCPKAWQGQFQGKDGGSTIVLEAVSDYNLWLWHCAYGFAGSMNDLNILAASPLLSALLDGTFGKMETSAGVVPYEMSGEVFNEMFMLADGIYPKYSRFVKGISQPITSKEKAFTKWQESSRKDIERAFGVLQQTFQFAARPIYLFELEEIGKRIRTCLILHNIVVSDRVMEGDVHAVYNPAFQVNDAASTGNQPRAPAVPGVHEEAHMFPDIGIQNIPDYSPEAVNKRWEKLADPIKHKRLQQAIINYFD